jgi:hypothetical protein
MIIKSLQIWQKKKKKTHSFHGELIIKIKQIENPKRRRNISSDREELQYLIRKGFRD